MAACGPLRKTGPSWRCPGEAAAFRGLPRDVAPPRAPEKVQPASASGDGAKGSGEASVIMLILPLS